MDGKRPRAALFLTLLVGALWWSPGTAARASFPGADGRIVFAYEAPVPGQGLTQNDLFTVAADGSDLDRLTSTPFRHEIAPAWSANGASIAFMRTKAPFGPGSIWVMDANGGHQVRLTTAIDARDPVWSPNGQRIAVTVFGPHGNVDVVTMRATDGGGRRIVTGWPSAEFEPAWSPDGRSMAFTRGFRTGDPGDIWTIDLVSGEATRVTSSAAYDHQASWSPDGDSIVFERAFDVNAKIVLVRADGSGSQALTRGHFDADPSFSPSGARIVFCSDRQELFLPDLWTMTPAGSDLTRIRDRPYASTMPDWQALPPV
jgi:TolB protein